MNTIVKSSHGITLVPVTSKLLAERKIFIEDEITLASACDIVKSFMLLVKEDYNKLIDTISKRLALLKRKALVHIKII